MLIYKGKYRVRPLSAPHLGPFFFSFSDSFQEKVSK